MSNTTAIEAPDAEGANLAETELKVMHLKDQYAELARAAGSPGDAWFGDPLESHEEVLERIKSLAEKAWMYDGLAK
ncbi:hypothetical protein JEY40_24560 [Bradyrhizobium japonicum]|uniref:hypothetical protein n=1 Tax=Bradyrhizobium japonicum TaxID=375 RepID=UPI00200D4F92|nr:hypothetical protein [Bradyrhizobium japonicum]UQD69191.1 hypothetical protein JEY40_24560 [Bradyrhizobium japonicum]WAX24453.1 hypothetical protein [Bradyrhizobium phage ppBjS10J-1]